MFNLSSKNLLDNLILLPLLWSFTGMFLYPDGRKLMVILVLLSAFSSVYSYGIKQVIENIKANKLIWVLGSYCIFAILAKTYYGYSSSLMRALICLFIYLSIFPSSLLSKINFKYLIIIGTITSCLFVMYQTLILNQGRMWSINPIPYATFSASLSIVAFYYLLQSKTIKHCLLWLSTFVAAVIPLLYSQSRGLWLALGIVMVIVIIKSLFNHKKSVYLLLPFILAAASAYYISHDKITQRIVQTKIEIEQVMQGNLNTSIGLRLQMWKAAIILSKESVIIGLGDNHKAYKEELAEQKIISSQVIKFTHYHNQFLNELVKYGIIGLALLLFSIILPFYYLNKNNSQYTWPGFLIIGVYIIASLTDVPFQHAQTLIFYFIVMYMLGSHTNKSQATSNNNLNNKK